MKILLIGEYSGVHSNLKKLLIKNGHTVHLIHDGDSYKKFDGNDFSVFYNRITLKNKFLNKFISIVYLILDIIGVKGIFQCIRFRKEVAKLQGFDIVQIINTKPFGQFGSWANYYLLRIIFRNNNKIYLCALGDDFTWVKSCLAKKPPYSMFDNLKIRNIKDFIYSLNYIYGGGAKFVDNFVMKNIEGVIPGLYDYYFAYKVMGRECSEIIPIAYELEINKNIHKVEYPIRIFHGWQSGKELRKGNFIFDNAIKRLLEKYPELIRYDVVRNIPYKEYIELFNHADIIIDQCFSLDRGMNALLGMAHGKVVFSGCDPLAQAYYANGIEKCLINAEPDENKIFQQLEELILDKEKITEIQYYAKKYAEEFHSFSYVYMQYSRIWGLDKEVKI